MNDNISYRVLGLMSGTSLDGVDLAICSFTKNKNWHYKIEKSTTIKYSKYWLETLSNLHKKPEKIINEIDLKYGDLLSKLCNKFLKNEKIDYISSHGHTIFHQPENNFTLQIGNGNVISKNTKKITISNFRNLDVSLKGQGAPLVPVGDKLLFRKYKYCVNLGGFANVSIKKNNKIIAFDICPVNIILNYFSNLKGRAYDLNGCMAQKGNLAPDLLKKLNSLQFYSKKYPKSLSREWVEKNIMPLIKNDIKIEDVLHTLCEHIGIQIGKLLNDKEALFTGGGVFNSYLLSRIKFYSKSKIIIPDKRTIEFKEALIFAFLGVLRARGEVNCLQSVTGAIKDNCSGEINNP
ncbi:MAG: anhydro-N-acetylmuramic acid kinase [Flavobacteriales bacterium]|nr:anhydro-N-acetylmuramic acid kinase [Flavobacteriales bacterium]MDG1934309.1 anhydro-N-acetylmuramic acid kinase [Flavobacteriales bacterium]MDG2085785.1 anhydro-N-acetylmuramic acid kinase [Flavobacteriales bacterium]